MRLSEYLKPEGVVILQSSNKKGVLRELCRAVAEQTTDVDEVGLDVTEDDLAVSYRVEDVMEKTPPHFNEGTPLGDILRTIAETTASAFPVIDAAGKLSGIITIDEFRAGLRFGQLHGWLVAYDLMLPVKYQTFADRALIEPMETMRGNLIDYMPVVETAENPRLVGMLELAAVNRLLSGEAVRRRRIAEQA